MEVRPQKISCKKVSNASCSLRRVLHINSAKYNFRKFLLVPRCFLFPQLAEPHNLFWVCALVSGSTK